MKDYQNYVFSIIGASLGANANNWKAALESLVNDHGFGINPQPGQVQPLDAPHHGITIMIDGGGNARGRLWLPTNEPTVDDNGNRWFTHEIQVIADGQVPGSYVWAWDSKGGNAPRPFTPTVPVEPPIEPPPSSGLEARVFLLERDVATLQADVRRFGLIAAKALGVAQDAAKHGDAVQVTGSMALGDVARNKPVTWTGKIL